jgi:hypothetical protein
MKFKLVLAVAFFLSLSRLAVAQEIAANHGLSAEKATTATSPVLEPEWPGRVMMIQDGKLVSLERQALYSEIRLHGFAGQGGGEKVLYVAGTTSDVVANTMPEFVLRLPGPISGDPVSLIGMDKVRVNSKKKLREVVLASQKGALGGKTSTATEEFVVLKFEMCGENLIKFTPTTPLAPGDYMIVAAAAGSVGFMLRVE